MPLRCALLLVLAVALLAGGAYGLGCDCSDPLASGAAPVRDASGVVYQNRCVAECQGAVDVQPVAGGPAVPFAGTVKAKTIDVGHSNGADTEAEGIGSAQQEQAPTVDWTKVDTQSAIGPEVWGRYSAGGYKFSAKVLLKSGLGRDLGLAPQTAGSSPSANANRTLLAAKLSAEGHLYLKAVQPGEAGETFSSAFAPGSPPSTLIAQGTARRLHAQGSLPSTAAALASRARAGRRMLVVGSDDRVEVDSAKYPWSAVGALLGQEVTGTGGETALRICSGALISGRHVLTAGHCVYDSAARQFYDITNVRFFPNLRGGPPQTRAEAANLRQVEIDSVFTYFNEAGPAQDCPTGEENACQSEADFFYDFAVVTLAEDLSEEYGYLGYGYQCGWEEYQVETAGYPGDLEDSPFRMYATSGTLEAFDACRDSGLDNSLVRSDLDTAQGQSGSGIWDEEYIIRALVNGGTDYVPLHRTISKWVYGEVRSEVEGPSASDASGSESSQNNASI